MNLKPLCWTVALLSAALLGFEVSLLRLLLLASWHHFAFLVISIALLGFGASGTALTLLRPWLMPRASGALVLLVLGTALSMPACTSLAQLVPVEARFLPLLLWKQVGFWVLYWILLGIPFLLGASVIGLALMVSRERVAAVYAANLAGSGAGALLSPLAMTLLPPEWLPVGWGTLALLSAGALRSKAGAVRWGTVSFAALLAVALVLHAWGFLDLPRVKVDPYKYLAHVRRLEQQQSVERIASVYGPRAVVEVYRGDEFHDMPFLSVDAVPPRVDVLLMDGHLAGSVLRTRTPEDASVVDQTLMSFPYMFVSTRPEVLLLGERGGLNVWLAARRGARVTDVVQPDEDLFAMLRERSDDNGGRVLDLPGVRAVAAEPRHRVEVTKEKFDLVQLVTLESSAAGSGGMGGLGQDYLTTVEGVAACLRALSSEGLLSVCRGIQTPPRDNLKLLATLISSLGQLRVDRPKDHIVIVRDYLAVCTMVRRAPWKPEQITLLRRALAERELTPVWFPGVTPGELNRPDELPRPKGEVGDWYHHAARKLFSQEAETFMEAWAYSIEPPTDDRPFFLDFCKLESLGALKRDLGPLWLTRAEVAFLFVLGALVVVGVLAILLTILPLIFLRETWRQGRKTATAFYFTALGLGYIILEMTVLSRLTLLIGDPVYAAAMTLSGFLFFSGVGSLVAERVRRRRSRVPRGLLVLLVLVGVATGFLLESLALSAGVLPFAVRCGVAVLLIAPLAFLMGFPMPLALARLDGAAPVLIPWAWGVNGFASVMAAPLATLLAMTWGFHVAGATALILYLVAAGLFASVPALWCGRPACKPEA